MYIFDIWVYQIASNQAKDSVAVCDVESIVCNTNNMGHLNNTDQ